MTITSTEIRSLALLNAGYASEVQNKSSYALSWAMSYSKKDGSPENNSGYSIGTLQSDLGQRPQLVSGLVTAYYAWAGTDASKLLDRTESELTSVLKEQGRYGLVPNANSADLSKRPLSSEEKTKFNTFLQTDSGKQAVWEMDLKQIDEKLLPFAQRVISSQTFQSFVSEDDQRYVLTAAMKLFNQSEAIAATRSAVNGGNLISKMESEIVSWANIESFINSQASYIQSGFQAAMRGADLYTKVRNSNTPLSSWLKDLEDQDLSQTSLSMFAADPRFQVLERIFRDTKAGDGFVNSLEKGQPALMTLPNGLDGQARIVGIDKAGHLFSADANGDNFKRFSDGQWTDSFGNYPRSDLPILKSNNGKMILALGTEEIELGDTAVAQVNINGVDVTLDAGKGGQYAFANNGDLFRSDLSADETKVAGEILTGQYAGYSFSESVSSGGAAGSDPSMLYASDSISRPSNTSTDRLLTLDDGNGNQVTIYRHTVVAQTDTGLEMQGVQTITTSIHSGITQSIELAFKSADGRITTTDATINNPTTGTFLSHTISTTAPDTDTGRPRTTESSLDANGAQISRSVTSFVGVATQVSIYNASDVLQSTTTSQTYDDGTSLVTVKYRSGLQTVITTATDSTSRQIDYTDPSASQVQTITERDATGAITSITDIAPTRDEANNLIANTYDIVKRDGDGIVLATGVRAFNPADGASLDTWITSATANDPSGTISQVRNNPDGNQTAVLNNIALANLGIAAQGFNDAYSLIQAIQHQQPLPALASGLRLYNDVYHDAPPALNDAATTLGALSSLYGLGQALKRGDTGGAIIASANSFSLGVTAYANIVYGDAINAAANGMGSLLGASRAVGDAIPYLNLVNDLVGGNLAGAAGDSVGIAVAAELSEMAGAAAGPIGAFVGLLVGTILGDIFGDDPPQPWGSANAYWDTGTQGIQVNAQGGDGGDQITFNALSNLIGSLQSIVGHYNASATSAYQQVGLIAQRLGGISYASGFMSAGFAVNTTDPTTGQSLNPGLHFRSGDGLATGVEPSNPAYFQSLGQYYVGNALARQAIAPQWEVATANAQAANHLSNAGLSEVERDANRGLLASPLPAGATTEQWNPIGLDLGGGLSTTGLSASVVQFAVDGSAALADTPPAGSTGYLHRTAWLNGNDGFLVLDKNLNNAIDNGEELFSNARVAGGARGIASLATWDANGDGIIDASDPVYAQLKVWRDANGDGRIEPGEALTLADMGITALNYQMGTYTRSDDSVHQMATLDLQASAQGTSYTPVAGGIRMNTTGGQVSIAVTQVQDLSSVVANTEAVSTEENAPAIMQLHGNGSGVQGLLDSVHVANAPNALINIAGVGNAQHGSVSYDATSGQVTFTPDAYYWGNDAGFDVRVDAGAYGQAIEHVQVNVRHIDQAPHITGEHNTQTPLYGYQLNNAGTADAPAYESIPLTQPGWGYQNPDGSGGWAYRDQPVAWLNDPYSGDFSVVDPDDAPSSLSWSIVQQPHFGTASVDAQGHWTFSVNGSAPAGQDAFVVQVSDPSGLSDRYQMTVTLPSSGSGGDGPIGSDGADGIGGDSDADADSSDGSADGDGDGGGDGGGGAGDPIILDLQGTGFHFKSVDDSNVFFAQAGDGWRHRTAWFTGGNGVLALDKYGDGIVHDSSQIDFSTYTKDARNALQGLAAFDLNHDDVIDKSDAVWGRLGVWVDADDNGVGSAGEFKTLDQLGITSISLQGSNHFATDQGVVMHSTTTFTRSDGSQGQAADVVLPISRDVLATDPDGAPRITQVAQANPNHPITVADGDYLVLGNHGDNIIHAGTGRDVIITGSGNDMIAAGDGNNLIQPGDGRDVIAAGQGNNTILLGAGNKFVALGNGNNLVAGGSGNNLVFAGGGDNLLYAGSGNSLLKAGNGNNTLLGGIGHNELLAGNGSNIFNDGGGIADMHAGTGSNTFVVTNASDTIHVKAGGRNTVKTSVNWTLGDNQQVLWGTGSQALTLRGNDLGDQIIGNGAADILIGGTGDDTLVDSGGAATLVGGGGNNTFVVSNAGTVVKADGDGEDTVKTSVSYSLPTGVKHLVGTGFANLTLTGGSEDGVTLAANDGNDTLVAGTGVATLIGGHGDTTFVVNNGADVVIAQAWGNTNTVFSSVSYAVPANVQKLIGTGTADITLTGGAQAITIQANDGNDTLIAGTGDTTLIAGAGHDTLIGGSGADTYRLFNAQDTVRLGSGSSTVVGSDARVLLTGDAGGRSAISLGNGDSQIDLSMNHHGNRVTLGNGGNAVSAGDGDNVVQVGSGANAIMLGNGSNSVTAGDAAGTANTIRIGDGINVVHVGQGGNQITLGNGTNTLTGGNGANVVSAGRGAENITLGDGNNRVTTSDAAGTIDTIRLGNGNNQLRVGQGDDQIVLGNGTNTVLGGDGANQLSLGSGSNSVTLGWGNNQINAADAVGSANAITLGNGANRVALGAGNNRLTLGQGANRVTAGNGANVIGGGNGANQVTLGAGSNTVTLGDGNDAITAQDTTGSVNRITLGQGNDTLTLGDGDNHVIAGNGAGIVRAGNGRNTVVLGSGQDSVTLGHGNNTVTLGNGNDLVTTGDGDNTVSAGNGSSQVRVGNGRNNVTVGNGNNSLTTGSGVNALHVGTGQDTIYNRGGTDTLYFAPNVAADTLNFARTGADVLVSELVTGGSVRVVGAAVNAANGIAQYVVGDGKYTARFDDGSYNFAAGNGNDAVYGNAGAYRVSLGNGNNLVQFGNGNDMLTLGHGNNQVTVGNGNDTIAAGDGNNLIRFGSGNDSVTAGNGNNVITQSLTGNTDDDCRRQDKTPSGSASVTVGDGRNAITLGNGNDSVTVGNGNNSVTLGSGTSQIVTGRGVNDINLGSGRYTLINRGGTDTVHLSSVDDDDSSLTFTASGQDLLLSSNGDDRRGGVTVRVVGANATAAAGLTQFAVGNGEHRVSFDSANYAFAAGDGDNAIRGGNGANTLALGSGENRVQLGNGNNQITLGRGENTVTLGSGSNTIRGGDGENDIQTSDVTGKTNVIQLGNGENHIAVGQGNDRITVGNGQNSVSGGNGNNVVQVGSGSNSVVFGNGNNTVTAADTSGRENRIRLGSGNNTVTVGSGNDSIVVGNGNNAVTLGAGKHSLTLGNGADTIRTNGGRDTLTLGTGQYTLINANARDDVALTSGAYNKLWFQQQGNDLVMTVLGNSERLTVANWFSGGVGAQLNTLTSSDGRSINGADITKLVQAMSAFTAPTAGQLNYTPQEQQALAPLMASAWHR
ncbi:Ig-like domain-containing protein [Variovorax terrae]|uniref:VCBS domain-containing protein n=1 Tax=Variovorax terrae TaxID=2923278 RepID=A0A9X2AN57_9BURK|nr:VCBS domain-containing protein [Variovorax terrae]MCJ0762037.1 VCBS domain-containing protein [Variovorax terrae]